MSLRQQVFRDLTERELDVLVIGCGITGAGIARDAALRGLKVALVERNDLASGTSSRSSRLIHGGVRYLEYGQFGLVLEASRERRRLLRLAPHLVRPLQFLWPVYRGARVPGWQLNVGLWLYDALAAFRNVGRHERVDADEVREREPRLRGEGLRGGATYWDASTDDVRLTLATVLDAARHGATVVTHAEVVGLDIDRGVARAARVKDRLDDGAPAIDVRARVIVNATGPWSDGVRRMEGTTTPAVRGSRGSHISIPREKIGNRGALTLLSPFDGRVFFTLPDGDRTIIGTTDTFTDLSPDDVRASEKDVEYLLGSARHFFPQSDLRRQDVLAAWTGIRPLIAHGSKSERSSSREHAIEVGPAGVLSITGGKLTTYRVMAADVVDAIARRLGMSRSASPTLDRPLPGGAIDSIDSERAEAADALGDAPLGSLLVAAYGTEWRRVSDIMLAEPALQERIAPERREILAQLVHGIEHEFACTLGDLLIRRTRIAWETKDHGRAAASRAAEFVAKRYGWDDARRTRELAAYEQEIDALFSVVP